MPPLPLGKVYGCNSGTSGDNKEKEESKDEHIIVEAGKQHDTKFKITYYQSKHQKLQSLFSPCRTSPPPLGYSNSFCPDTKAIPGPWHVKGILRILQYLWPLWKSVFFCAFFQKFVLVSSKTQQFGSISILLRCCWSISNWFWFPLENWRL